MKDLHVFPFQADSSLRMVGRRVKLTSHVKSIKFERLMSEIIRIKIKSKSTYSQNLPANYWFEDLASRLDVNIANNVNSKLRVVQRSTRLSLKKTRFCRAFPSRTEALMELSERLIIHYCYCIN